MTGEILYANKITFKHIFIRFCYPFIRTANKINWRFGRPYKCDLKSLDHLRHKLKPGMLILSHKDYELTNLFIRGHWTHVAFIIPGGYIVEAISKGVIKKKIDDFIESVDEFIVLQPGFCDFQVMEMASDYVQRVIGYPYNFSFYSREDSYYCSELVYRAYAHSHHRTVSHEIPPPGIHDFRPGEILIPQNLIESELLWHVVA